MASEEDQERKALYRDVEYGRLSPAEAEDRLRQLGVTPFESRPDLSSFNPMQEDEWTLPMAAAWFIWRSADAVRDQWKPAREGWWKWTPLPPQRSVGPPRRRWKLNKFGPATLADVFEQARLRGSSSQGKSAKRLRSGGSPARTHNPYDRLKVALQTGVLQATWGSRRKGDFEKISRDYWPREFDVEANSKGKNIIRPSKTKKNATEARRIPPTVWIDKVIQNALSHSITSDLTDIADLSLVAEVELRAPLDEGSIPLQFVEQTGEAEASSDANSRREVGHFHGKDLDEIFMLSGDVKRAEREIAQREYEFVDWDLGQALGWVAYRKVTNFRSLQDGDLLTPPTYYGIPYLSDFLTPDPAKTLGDELKLGDLIAYLDGVRVPQEKWLGHAVWDYPDATFLRADILKIWKECDSAGPEKQGPVSAARARQLYLKARQENGGSIGVHRAFEKLKDEGITSLQVREIAKELDPTARERGRKKRP